MNDFEERRNAEIERLMDENRSITGMFLTRFSCSEPKPGLLTESEILMYAPNSNTAIAIKIKNGDMNFLDKWALKDRVKGINLDEIVYKPPVVPVEPVEPVKTKADEYFEQLENTKNLYKKKLLDVYRLINEYFPPPQITNDRFKNEIANWNSIFVNKYKLGVDLIDIGNFDKIHDKFVETVEILHLIVDKIEDLIIELTIQSNNKNNDIELNNIINDMKTFVDTVKLYKA